jgi:DNA-directed RNA polymerase subunit beta'
MAVHVPLGNAAILEAQLLMLAPHNILNPANGSPITVPSQDMVLGLYYITKGRKHTPEKPVKGEGITFYSPEEVTIAYNEGKVDLHAFIKCRLLDLNEKGETVPKIIETSVGRVLFNKVVPEGVGYINQLLTKKSLRDIISMFVKEVGVARTSKFLDDIKDLGFYYAFKGGLSFNLNYVEIPDDKEVIVEAARKEVEEIKFNYENGFITNNERYNQVIDVWTKVNSRVGEILLKELAQNDQGFNPVFMMLDSGARGSKEQIRQLGGMRGLMAKPQKNVGGGVGEIIENPILSNFKEGLSVLEYFISTHGARKGLADTALKTADAGYLTRRLHDVAQDVIITDTDCGTIRGLNISALKDNDDIVESLYERILGRTGLYDTYNPSTNELIVKAGLEITEEVAAEIEKAGIEELEIRSVLTCETKTGVCAKCYGRNLANGRMVQMGEAVGVIAAQSIGEPGTQLTLRTFHVGGTASSIAAESQIVSKHDGMISFDELKTVPRELIDEETGETIKVELNISRSAEVRVLDVNTKNILNTFIVPYGSFVFLKEGAKLKKGDKICSWDPYNAVILSDLAGKIVFDNIIDGITFREENDEVTGYGEKVVIETKDKTKTPSIRIVGKDKTVLKEISLPVGAHLAVEEGKTIIAGDIIAKIPRSARGTRDITGGLPRVTELFEARNPSNPATVAEIDGVVTYGGIKRGNREIAITSKDGEVKHYMIPLSKHIFVQDNDYIKAGSPLSDGAITPQDILRIQGPTAVQRYILNGIQEVYRLQGVKINDKHIEIIVRQMMQKMIVEQPGDTQFLENEIVEKWELFQENDWIYGRKFVLDSGDSDKLKVGQIVSLRELREENSLLKRQDKKEVLCRDAVTATADAVLQGITRASLATRSFMSAASFQETTKVLNEAAIAGKVDYMRGLKENVIVGHLIPAGTGMRQYDGIVVGSKEEFERLQASKQQLEDNQSATAY